MFRGSPMIQTLRGRLLAVVLFAVTTGTPAFAQQPPSPPFRASEPRPFVWWKSEGFKKELSLTGDQIARIDKIWATTRAELRLEYDELSKLEGKFSRLIRNDADEAVLSRQIDRVEMARANANKTRSLMLVQMRKALTLDQRVILDAIHSRWLEDQKRPEARPAPQRKGPPERPQE